MQNITIKENEAGQRFDKFLKKYLSEASPSFLYKMLRKKNIVLNGRKANGHEILKIGDEVKLFFSDETFAKFRGTKELAFHERKDTRVLSNADTVRMPPLVYEDHHILICNKPAGMLSQKAAKEDLSLAELLIQYLTENGSLTEESGRAFRPAPVNRLDKNTSGLVLCGKTLAGLQYLSALLKSRDAGKFYYAIVRGDFRSEGLQKAWLRKDERTNKVQVTIDRREGSREIKTGFRKLAGTGAYSLVEAELLTGRTHQIRAHLAYLGYPIIGDPKYGERATNAEIARQTGVRRQLLHAERIVFPNQVPPGFETLKGRVVTGDLPEDFRSVMTKLGLHIPE